MGACGEVVWCGPAVRCGEAMSCEELVELVTQYLEGQLMRAPEAVSTSICGDAAGAGTSKSGCAG